MRAVTIFAVFQLFENVEEVQFEKYRIVTTKKSTVCDRALVHDHKDTKAFRARWAATEEGEFSLRICQLRFKSPVETCTIKYILDFRREADSLPRSPPSMAPPVPERRFSPSRFFLNLVAISVATLIDCLLRTPKSSKTMDSLDREDQKKSLIELNNRCHICFHCWRKSADIHLIQQSQSMKQNSLIFHWFLKRLVSYVEKVRKLQEAADVIDSIPRTTETSVFLILFPAVFLVSFPAVFLVLFPAVFLFSIPCSISCFISFSISLFYFLQYFSLYFLRYFSFYFSLNKDVVLIPFCFYDWHYFLYMYSC